MIELEKPSSIVLRFHSKLTGVKRDVSILSKKIKYQGIDSFSVGLKCYSSTLLFLTMNLNKIGLKATNLSFWSVDDFKMKPMEMNVSRKEDENGAIQVFKASLKSVGTTCSFFFKVFLDGTVENYRVHQLDGLMSQQLLSSNQHGTDSQLMAKDGASFPVHKWMLAARSSVFATLFCKQEIEQNHAMDYAVNEMKQFIKFIYIGELEGPITHELMQLAIQYQIRTLEDLCQAALQYISLDSMATVAFHLLPGYGPLYDVNTIKPDSDDLKIIEQGEHIFKIFKIKWKVDSWVKENYGSLKEDIAESEAFEHGENKLFRAEIKSWNEDNKQQFKIRFLSYGHENINCNTEKVTCSFSQDEKSVAKLIFRMTEKPTHDKTLLQMFIINQISFKKPFLSLPFYVTFHIKLRNTISTFINKMIDSTWSEQLWDAAVNRKMTDVEIRVGEKSFGAHRSLLCARSPVFAAMFASGMKEAEAGQVRIEDVDPDIFQYFLKFLYTGMFEHSSMDIELFTIADKYRVETLMELCRSATQTVDVDDLFKTFLFC